MKEKKNAWSRRFARRRAQKVSAPACAARAQHAIDACNTPEEGAYIRARAVHGVPGPAASLARSEYGFSSSLVPREREKSMFIYFRMFFFLFGKMKILSIWERPAETGHRARAVPFSRKRRSV